MSTDIKGLFFKDQLLGARGLGAFGSAALSDGILNGCEVTLSSGTATIAPGHIIVGGRVIRIANSIEVGSIGAAFSAIVATVDLTQTSTKSTFNQVSLSMVTNVSLASVLTDDSNDINLSGTTHSVWLWAYDATGTAVAVQTTYNYARSTGKQLLWTNSAPGDGFAEQTLIIPGMKGFNALEIEFAADQQSGARVVTLPFNRPGSHNMATEDRTGNPLVGASYYFGEASALGTYNGWSVAMWERYVRVYPDACGIWFSTGYLVWVTSGSHASSANYLVPVRIYGVNTEV